MRGWEEVEQTTHTRRHTFSRMLLRHALPRLATRLPAASTRGLASPFTSSIPPPSMPPKQTVFLGGGNAAGYFAAELKECGATDLLQGLTIVTDEAVRG